MVENPENSRIVTVTLADGTPLDMNRNYLVAAPSFTVNGTVSLPSGVANRMP